MSELKVNKISPRSGTDVALGDSGDTFTVPAGASIVNNGTATGFGATGAVNWDTTAKTANFNAVSKVGYFVDTTLGAITVTLPATPSAGDIVGLVDYAGTFDTNALTIDPNGEDLEGGTDNLALTGEREGVVLVYVDSTQGWLPISGINEGTDALGPVPYSIDFLVVAGGASGGTNRGAGGGAGGFRTSTQSVTIGTAITVTVGDGGALRSSSSSFQGNDGSNSSISGSGLTTITSTGGGGGGGDDVPVKNGRNGGSGGGSTLATGLGTVGLGNTPSTAPSQGNDGGLGANPGPPNYGAGGGGGASAVGGNGTTTVGGAGGAGTASSISGSSITRAGGGGGGVYSGGTGGAGGNGGGGAGGNDSPATAGTAGTVNTGGGGGGNGGTTTNSGAGGKGVVILSMPLANFSNTTTGSPTESDDGTTKVLVFNGDGSYTA
jgi:hypothetical protein